ncbi:MAG TPA: HAD-IC family P-type ATPase [Solirubrobacteraceae bacterium]|jgi:magnesium-transporting ATPase (P-type)|nr:HAD-IC family P-type ATPase [Solirubrobacteraceae bacterium]
MRAALDEPSAGPPRPGHGLSETEAAARLEARGKPPRQRSSRSWASIIRANTLNIPNGILFVFGVLTITFASWKDALFLGILVSNVVIGSFQEIRSKRALDRLAALVAPDAVVVRDGVDRRVPIDQVVVGDAVRLAAGNQVVADGTVITADGLALDEANLTGESEPVVRSAGEPVWSGSFAIEGAALFEATAVGADSRAAQLTATARAFRHPRSPLERANDRLLLWIIILAVPLAIGLTVSVLARVGSSAAQVQAITAGLVNLVPEGLILLISVTAAVSAFKIARRGVLAQQLNAVESLASVNLVCTDKTGTLTEPTPRVVALVPADGSDETTFARDLALFAASAPSRNLTLEAINDAGLAEVTSLAVIGQVPFSSRRRWSALDLDGKRLFLGAPERFINADASLKDRAREEASAGRRVLALGRGEAPLPTDGFDPQFPDDVQPLGLVVLAERLRPNAAATVAFFAEQHVVLKVLSGDAPATAGAIAHDAGVPGSAPALDGEALPSEPAALRDAVLSAPAVGRISPDGKRAVVDALTDAGRYVAMVGDGVNDVPALKEARLAIAQGSGAQIARSVADLVLVKDDFAAVPGMVGEGRQILRNIQRVARLFVTKTVFTAVVGLAVGITTATYPLLPRQFTLASTVTIGIPAFLLALAPSSGPWRPEGFLQSVARFAIPAGVTIGIGIVAGYLLARYGFNLGLTRSRTVATGIVVVCGLAVVMRLEPGGGRRRLALAGLSALMLALFAIALVVPFLREFYELSTPTGEMVAAWAVGTAIGLAGMLGALRVLRV